MPHGEIHLYPWGQMILIGCFLVCHVLHCRSPILKFVLLLIKIIYAQLGIVKWKMPVRTLFMKHNFGHRIRDLRGELSQKDFSEKVGVPLRTYIRYEVGERLPPGPILAKLAELGHVTVDWILTGAEPRVTDRVAEVSAQYGLDDVTLKILQMLRDMDPDAKCDVLKYAEKEKLLAELMRERKREAG